MDRTGFRQVSSQWAGSLELYGHYCEVNFPYQVVVSRSENLDEVSITVTARKLQLSLREFNKHILGWVQKVALRKDWLWLDLGKYPASGQAVYSMDEVNCLRLKLKKKTKSFLDRIKGGLGWTGLEQHRYEENWQIYIADWSDKYTIACMFKFSE